MSFTPPWRCMGANGVDGYQEQPMSAAAFAAALGQLDLQLREADGDDTVQVWVNCLYDDPASTEATPKGAAAARSRRAEKLHLSAGATIGKQEAGENSGLTAICSRPKRLDTRGHGDGMVPGDKTKQSSRGETGGYNGDGEPSRDAGVSFAQLPRLTDSHVLGGCHRSLPAEIIPLDLDYPLQDNTAGCSCPRHGKISRLHVAIQEYLRMPAHRWPGRWRGRRYKKRTWMSSFDGPMEYTTDAGRQLAPCTSPRLAADSI